MSEEVYRLANLIRALYPDAVRVEIGVNAQEVDVNISYKPSREGASYRTLDGEWSPEERVKT